MTIYWKILAICAVFPLGTATAHAADIKVLAAGAMKSVVTALAPDFENQTGHRLSIDNGTVGALAKRIADGEVFDVTIIAPAALDDLVKQGKIVPGSKVAIAKVGIGVAVRAGAVLPDISTVDALKKALLDARSVTYVDPKAGGSSGIYFDKLLETMGIADVVRAKAKLQPGGYVAELVARGEAEMAVHQISEILPVQGATLVGPLPAAVQNYTVYAASLSASAQQPAGAAALIKFLGSDTAHAVLKAKGMEVP